MRIAVVHDWLYTLGGAERVLGGILRCYPGADVFCLFDFLSPGDRRKIGYDRSTTSFLQDMPFMKRRHRMYLPLMPLAVEQLDLRGYDLIISSSYAVAKGVLTGPDQLHVSYVHSPMRYAWDLQRQYLQDSHLEHGIKGVVARSILHRMRIWDVRTAFGVDDYATNSHFVARRIGKLYGRTAEVIHPPVAVPPVLPSCTPDRHFLTASRLVPYKNTRVLVEAFSRLPNERLIVVGDGPERARLQALAGPNVEFRGFVEDAEMQRLMGTARAFLFAAEEDFGIVLVEAQGRGAPVIALGRGGARETVVTEGAAATGLFFAQPDADAVATAVRRFIAEEYRFRREDCHRNALRFSEARFDREFSGFVAKCQAAFAAKMRRGLAVLDEQDEPPPPVAAELEAVRYGHLVGAAE